MSAPEEAEFIYKIHLDIDAPANVVTLRFTEKETVGETLVRIASKLKLQLSREQTLATYAIVFKGIPSCKYFQLEAPIIDYLSDDCLKNENVTVTVVRRSYKIVIIGLNMENEYIHVDFCKERELEGLLGQMARQSGEKVKDLYFVSALNPDKELNTQKTLMDQNLVHEDVLLLKTRKRRKKTIGSKRIKKLKKGNMGLTRNNSFSVSPGSAKLKTSNDNIMRLHLPTIIFYTMRWIELNAIDTPCIFQLPGKQSEVDQLKKAFDIGYIPDLNAASDPFVICDLLKIGFRSMPPCLNSQFWDSYNQSTLENPLVLIKLLSELPTIHILLLKHLCTFLNRVCQHSSTNRMNSAALAQIFSPVFNPSSKASKITVELAKTLIDNPEWIPKKQHPSAVKNMCSSGNQTSTLQTVTPLLLMTEEIQWEHTDTIFITNNKSQLSGSLYISNYRLLFQYATEGIDNPLLDIPLSTILSVDRHPKSTNTIIIWGKNCVQFQLQFPCTEDCQSIFEYLRQFMPPHQLNQLFAFSYALFYETEGSNPMKSVLGDCYNCINPEVEYSRQGVQVPTEWRYFACKSATTYPRQILIPSSIREEQKDIFPKAYNNFRFPTLVYQHGSTSACLLISGGLKKLTVLSNTVSSPNLSRIQSNTPRSPGMTQRSQDSSFFNTPEKSDLINAIIELQPSESLNIIACLRPSDLSSIYAAHRYQKMLTFTDVTPVYTQLCKLIKEGELALAEKQINEWTLSLSEVILSAATVAVDLIRGESILLEDDEWNNLGTAARAMIIVDPFYRTIRGFQKLIEHVWIRFGFPFADAVGIDSNKPEQLNVATFVHFIDSVWQIFHQFPSCFEFNEFYLMALLNSLFSGCYGTFLSNNEKLAHSKLAITVSVWQYLAETNPIFVNPLYTCKDRVPLIPDTSTKKIVFWTGYFLQGMSQQGLARYKLKMNQAREKSSTLDMSNLFLSYLPDSLLVNKANVTELNLSYNNLSTFPTSIFHLKALETLNLSHNRIRSLPQDIIAAMQNLQGLRSFDLRGNPISSVDNSIAVISSLRMLMVGGNGEKQKLDGILSMTLLTHLSLENFGLQSLPDSISEMKNLESLSLAENQLTAITLSLSNIKFLNLSFNQLSSSSVNITCKQLDTLDLTSNRLQTIPPSILECTRLKKLTLRSNRLQRLVPEITLLKRLVTLDISNNEVKSIAPNICKLKKLQSFPHTGNPITFPPSHVVGKGTDILISFLKDRMNRSVPLRRVRLLLVGKDNVGKSSVFYYLKNGQSPPKGFLSTDGIQIDDWELRISTGNVVQPVEIKIWDFAGQEVYYPTHQLFLGGQSVYLLIWDIIQGDTLIRFWLESIKARATTGTETTVILVATHVDHELCTPEYVRDALGTMEKKYCSRFPFIKNIIGVSSATGEGFPQLRSIIKTIISEQKYIGKFIPTKHLFLEDEMQYLGKECVPPLISYDKFKQVASLFDINNDAAAEAVDLFQQWGSVIHHNDIQLRDMVILDPLWLIRVMATILTTKHRYVKAGLLKHSDLIHIWHENEYPRHFHPALLQLLQKFEVTYAIDTEKSKEKKTWEEGVSLVPSCLPTVPSKSARAMFPEFERTDQYAREYKFNFIPAGFINHLIIRVIHQTIESYYWRFGIAGYFREDPSSKVFLELLPQHSLLKVLVRGSASVKYFLLIIEIIEAFIESWFHLDVTMQVPCTHCFRERIQPLYKFTYETCKDAAVLGESYLPCPSGSSVRLDVLVPDLSMAEVPRIDYSEITIEKEIGKGGFATVYKARYNGNVVALKQIDLGEGSNLEDAYSDFMRESWIMSGIQHPNIIGFLGLCSSPLCIVTDFASNGNLFDFLHSDKPEMQKLAETLSLKCKIAYDISQGMLFLHNRIPAIIHADLKSPNILLLSVNPMDSIVAVVADFGLSRTWVPVLQGRQVDNPVWLAPEILCGKGYSESADVYAFGVILYEIFTLKEYFGEFTFMSALEDALIAGKRPPLPESIHPEVNQLIEACWHQEPTKRPSFEDISTTLRTLISKLVDASTINISEVSTRKEPLREVYQNQNIKYSLHPTTPITHAISVNQHDDVWCIEKGHISIWNTYDAYTQEKQIPMAHPVYIIQYCPIPNKSYGVVWTIDSTQTIKLWDSATTKLIHSQSFAQRYGNCSILSICCVDNAEVWVSTTSGLILTFNAQSLQPIIPSVSKQPAPSPRISHSIRSVVSKLGHPTQGVPLGNHTLSDNVVIYNCFKGATLRSWVQSNIPAGEDVTKIIQELFQKLIITPALKTKQVVTKKEARKFQENCIYILQQESAIGIQMCSFRGSLAGFELQIGNFKAPNISCFAPDDQTNTLWMGTPEGVVLFDLMRNSVAATITSENPVRKLLVADTNIWVSYENQNYLDIYDKISLCLVRQIEAHDSPVTALVYLDNTVWSASTDSSIKVWSSSHYNLLETFSDYHSSEVIFLQPTLPCESHVLSAAKDGSVAIWKYCRDSYWEYSSEDIERLKYQYFDCSEDNITELLNPNVEQLIKRVLSDDIDYVSLGLDSTGYLDVTDTALLPVDQLYESLPPKESCYVLYAYQQHPQDPPSLIFYLHNPDDAPQSHQTLYYELFDAVVSIVEAVVGTKISLTFVVDHASQLAEGYLQYQLDTVK